MGSNKVIVTGVAGFIGSNLAARLLEKNYHVTGIDNFSYGNKQNIEKIKSDKRFEFIEGDLLDYQILDLAKGDSGNE